MIAPLWGEADEAKRIAGWKEVDKYIAENALVIPLCSMSSRSSTAKGVTVTPHASGALLPHLMKRA
jgi:peptide/nickel transport system substrate-binding protein